MKEVHYWIADDGKQFSDSFDCEVYEEKQKYEKYFKKDCFCLDWKMNKVHPLDDVGEARFLTVKTQKAVDWICNQWDMRGYIIDGLTTPGMYAYNEGTYEWESIQDKLDFYTKAKEILEGA